MQSETNELTHELISALLVQSQSIQALAQSVERLAREIVAAEDESPLPAYDLTGKPIVIR